MPTKGKAAESIRFRKQLRRLAVDLGVDGRKRLWGSVKVSLPRGAPVDMASLDIVIYNEEKAVAVVSLSDLFDFATGLHPPYSD